MVTLWHDGSPTAVMRARIDSLVSWMLTFESKSFEPHVEHIREGGLYVRQMHIPKGTLLAGKIHRLACVNIVEHGAITVLTEHGCRRVAAGYMGVSKPGTQKIGYAHEDTVFTNVFRVEGIDIDQIEIEIAGTEHIEGLVIDAPEEI